MVEYVSNFFGGVKASQRAVGATGDILLALLYLHTGNLPGDRCVGSCRISSLKIFCIKEHLVHPNLFQFG